MGKSTKSAINNLSLHDLGWENFHSIAFDGFQEALGNVVKSAHPDPLLSICIHKATVIAHPSPAVTQCEASELQKPVYKQSQQPLGFLSSPFSSAQEPWSTYEKEKFSVVEKFRHLNYMLVCTDDISIFTDERGILFTFLRMAVDPSMGSHIV